MCLFVLKRSGIPGTLNTEQRMHSWVFFMWYSYSESTSVHISFFRMPGSQEYLGERLVFVFHYKKRRGGGVQDGCPLAQVTLWMMCMEHCLVQLSTLHSKRPFFQPKGKSSKSSDPALSQAPTQTPFPSPTPAKPQLLPALLPLAPVQLLHVA